jgi:hypothetical protein
VPRPWVAGEHAGVLLREDVIPLALTFVLALGILWLWARASAKRPPPPRDGRPEPGVGRLARHLLLTAAGGYTIFIVIVVVYYLSLGAEPLSFVVQALWGGAFLAFGAGIPVLLASGWLFHGGRRRRSGRSPLRRGRSDLPRILARRFRRETVSLSNDHAEPSHHVGRWANQNGGRNERDDSRRDRGDDARDRQRAR